MSSTFQSDFVTRYMDPTEVKTRFIAARRGVPEHRDARAAAAQDERLLSGGRRRPSQPTRRRCRSQPRPARRRSASSSTTGLRRRAGHLGRHRREPGAADDRIGRDAEPGVAGTECQPDPAADARARERRAVLLRRVGARATRPPATRTSSARRHHLEGVGPRGRQRHHRRAPRSRGCELASERRGRRDRTSSSRWARTPRAT